MLRAYLTLLVKLAGPAYGIVIVLLQMYVLDGIVIDDISATALELRFASTRAVGVIELVHDATRYLALPMSAATASDADRYWRGVENTTDLVRDVFRAHRAQLVGLETRDKCFTPCRHQYQVSSAKVFVEPQKYSCMKFCAVRYVTADCRRASHPYERQHNARRGGCIHPRHEAKRSHAKGSLRPTVLWHRTDALSLLRERYYQRRPFTTAGHIPEAS